MNQNEKICDKAITSCNNASDAFCKFLSANDTGSNHSHQAGILISKSAMPMIFGATPEGSAPVKKTVEIIWNDNITTQSIFTWYYSKNELRITNFGKGFPYKKPDQTGSLFVLTKISNEQYRAFFLDSDEEIDNFLTEFNLSPTETNRMFKSNKVIDGDKKLENYLESHFANFTGEIPPSVKMAEMAETIELKLYDQPQLIITNPDKLLVNWTNIEYSLFRKLENTKYLKRVQLGFKTLEDFLELSLKISNSRKSRAGKSLEHHLEALFKGNDIQYTAQGITEERKRPDFIFPSISDYHDTEFPTDKLVTLAAKTTCKDRWRQIINEADRLRDANKYLCTLQQGISSAQLKEMQDEKVILVVPKAYISSYPKEYQNSIYTLSKFISLIKELQK